MKAIFFFVNLFALLLTIQCKTPIQAQPADTYEWTYTLSDELSFATVDALQQIYIATEEGKIIKLDKNGRLLFENSNKRLGEVGMIDASNPFNILVYYPEFATVIFLDRTLSEIKSINLFDLQIFESKAVALSNDNNIWVYDPINFQLKKISKEGKILFQSKNLNQLIDSPIQPSFLVEQNNHLLLSDTTQGIFIFDAFGQFRQQIKTVSCSQFQLSDNQIFYFKKGKLYSFSLLSEEEKVLGQFPNAAQVLLLDEGYLVIEGRKMEYQLR